MSSRWMAVLKQRQANLSKKDVTCQKCLQKGHWTYECKNPRKYVHRTSRSQELNKQIKQAQKRKLQTMNIESKKRKKSASSDSDSSSDSSDSSSSSSSDSSSTDSSSASDSNTSSGSDISN